jgi:hypothetical protein
MTTVEERAVIAAAPEAVWAVAGRFDGLAEWVPAMRSCRLLDGPPAGGVGAVRELTMRDGGRLLERQIERSEEERFYSYQVIETALPTRDYRSTIRLLPGNAPNETVLTWSGSFEADPAASEEIARLVRSIYRLGIRTLQKQFSPLA